MLLAVGLLLRRFKEREAVFALDDGAAPPLSPPGPPGGAWGRLLGTEAFEPSDLAYWKATAVCALKPSMQSFRKEYRSFEVQGVRVLGGFRVQVHRHPGPPAGHRGLQAT